MTEKVVIFLPSDPEPVARAFALAGGFIPRVVHTAADALQELKDANGLVVGGSNYPSLFPMFRQQPTSLLRWIQSAGSGYDSFERLGVPPGVSFMRAVGVWGHSVAGHAVALTLALLRNLPELHDAQRNAHWARVETMHRVRSVAGRCVLVLGYGDIGRIMAATFKTLDADVRIIASRARTEPTGEHILGLDGFDALLPEADALVMAVPTTTQTNQLVNAARIARMRKDAVVVNVGRGETIDTDALVAALTAGKLAGAALDVFEQEPLPANSKLWHCPNLVITPHIANCGDTRSAEKIGALAVANAKKIARDELPTGLVCVPEFTKTGSY